MFRQTVLPILLLFFAAASSDPFAANSFTA